MRAWGGPAVRTSTAENFIKLCLPLGKLPELIALYLKAMDLCHLRALKGGCSVYCTRLLHVCETEENNYGWRLNTAGSLFAGGSFIELN